MKGGCTLPYIIGLIFLVAIPQVNAQDSAALPSHQELKIKERTILAKFDADMVLSADERLQKKLDRRELILKRHAIIDTLNISERRRKRLLKELYNSPLSNRWNKLVTKLDFEEDPQHK